MVVPAASRYSAVAKGTTAASFVPHNDGMADTRRVARDDAAGRRAGCHLLGSLTERPGERGMCRVRGERLDERAWALRR